MSEAKSLDVVDVKDAQKKVNDIVVYGNGDTFQLLCTASSTLQGWTKSAKACEIPDVGCIVQVSTQQGQNIAEALVFVPDVKVEEDVIHGGKRLVGMYPMDDSVDGCMYDGCDDCSDDDCEKYGCDDYCKKPNV